MENASKALLIAGSVLIVILLIAMGVRVFNSTQGTADETESAMKTAEMAQFNSKFTQFVGKNKRKAEVMSLINQVIAHNNTNSRKVKIAYSTTTTDTTSGLNTILTNISNATKSAFNITVTYDTNNGYITTINIS